MKIKHDEEIVDVGAEDCMIVFKADGSMEAYIPPYQDDSEVSEAAAAVLLIGVLFSEGPEPQRFRQMLMEFAVNYEPPEEEGEVTH